MGALVKITLLISFCFLKNVSSVNILYISQIASPSHHIWNRALAFGLVEKGYNVTMLTHDQEKKPPPKNFHTILLEGIYDVEYADFDMKSLIQDSAFSCIKKLYDWSSYLCEFDFKTKGLKTLMNYPKDFKFDMIIYDLTAEMCFYPLFKKFNNPPTVAVTPFLLPPSLSSLFGNPLQTAYFPFYSTTYSNRMSFIERFYNTIYIYADVLYRKYVALPAEMKLAQQFFGPDIQDFQEVERNFSLLLCNYDPVMSFPLDLPPNIIPVGGLQIKPPKALPEDLQKIVDGAKEGIVLFTLGSNLRSDKLSPEIRKIILDAFRKISQTVIWKFETELDGLPKNVVIRKWLPQNDILGNPKTRAFISHGGGLGTQEAMYHGVPVLAIPFSFDHRANAARLVNRNMAVSVDFTNFTYDNFYAALQEILNNPKYRKNIKDLSKKYKDQPQTALERAIFWIEYVMRHGGAEHLTVPTRDMAEWQANNLDILVVLILGVVLLYSLILLIFASFKFIRVMFK